MRWIDFPGDPIQVCGLPWFKETRPRLWRLPERMKDWVRPELWNASLWPSGARLRFSTDASALGLRARYSAVPPRVNMHRFGQMGVDLYVDNEYYWTLCPDEDGRLEGFFFRDVPSRLRNVTLYLPLYAAVEVEAVGINEGANVWEPGPFSVSRPMVFYGTSITQGSCAGRPGMSYPAILARDLLLDFVNLGFSGQGKGDAVMARAMTEIDAACYVLDFAQNCASAEELGGVYGSFIDTVRRVRRDVPILCITPIHAAAEAFDEKAARRLADMRQVIRQAVSSRSEAGDCRLHIVEGTRLLGRDDVDGLADGVHPNDLGYQRIAERLSLAVLEALRPAM